jgi:hypothetical protein
MFTKSMTIIFNNTKMLGTTNLPPRNIAFVVSLSFSFVYYLKQIFSLNYLNLFRRGFL